MVAEGSRAEAAHLLQGGPAPLLDEALQAVFPLAVYLRESANRGRCSHRRILQDGAERMSLARHATDRVCGGEADELVRERGDGKTLAAGPVARPAHQREVTGLPRESMMATQEMSEARRGTHVRYCKCMHVDDVC